MALAAVTLKDLVDSKTGELRREVQMRDLPQLMRVGAELVLLSTVVVPAPCGRLTRVPIAPSVSANAMTAPP